MDVEKTIEQVFRDAPFVAHLGIVPEGLGPGWCEARLDLQPWHLQQTGVAHAGVIATLADHCAGAAASTQLPPGEFVVTAEFKINLLRGARGERLLCRADVLKSGQALSVVEAVVFAEHGGKRQLVAKLNATMAVVRPRPESAPVPAAPTG
ncbi:MAG: PaaI family thioesterase [Steroidobacteraceae bacterium]|nr:PaaI family thioesterase [Steroidobacteraceae bacterium]